MKFKAMPGRLIVQSVPEKEIRQHEKSVIIDVRPNPYQKTIEELMKTFIDHPAQAIVVTVGPPFKTEHGEQKINVKPGDKIYLEIGRRPKLFIHDSKVYREVSTADIVCIIEQSKASK